MINCFHSKEQLQLALRKKKECNAKAQKIVEALLDPVDDVDKFLIMVRQAAIHVSQMTYNRYSSPSFEI